MKSFCFSQRVRLLSAVCAGSIAFVNQTAFAQTTPVAASAQNNSGDIIVTANRREEFAQKVGTSLTAISAARLDSQNIRTAEDLGRLIPGLNATASTGTGVSTFVIRGVGETDFSDHQEQPNASYQDGTYVPFSDATGVPLFDLQRVEVLRGPQGTLFGRNATGGLIQYISNKPTPGFNGDIEAALGQRSLRRVQGFFDGGTEKVAARVAYYYQTQDGFIKNVAGPNRGDKEVFALRGQVLIKPTETTSITLRADGFNQNGTAPGYKATPSYYDANGVARDLPPNLDVYGTGPGNDPYGYRNPYKGLEVDLNSPDKLDKRVRNVAATVEQGVGNATITSITSYGHIRSQYLEDTDSGPINEFSAGVATTAHAFQEDTRISGTTGRLRYTAGGYFLEIHDHTILFNTINNNVSGPVPIGETNFNDFTLRTRSEAIYGQAEYDLTEKLTAIVGARYSWDQLKLNIFTQCTETDPGACATYYGAGPAPGSNTVIGFGPTTAIQKNSDWSGKAQINYKPTNDILLYASASKGLKGAGFTAPAGTFQTSSLAYKPENLFAYEVGEKAQLLNKKITLNSSFYYYHYKNLQSFLFTGLLVAVINRPATAYGGEFELTAHPTQTLTANASLAYNHFLIRDVPLAVGDQRPNNAPRLMLNWGLSKKFYLGDDYDIQLNYYGRRNSAVFYNIVNTPSVKAKPYLVNDFSIRLEAKKGYYVAANLNNAFNKLYQVGAFDVTYFGYILRQYGEPRTFSVSAGIKF